MSPKRPVCDRFEADASHHQDLASLAGLRRESVSLAMGELELRDLIKARRGSITILDPKQLDQVR